MSSRWLALTFVVAAIAAGSCAGDNGGQSGSAGAAGATQDADSALDATEDASSGDSSDSATCNAVPSQTCAGCVTTPAPGDELKCFELSPSYSVCGLIVAPDESTTCTADGSFADECGCDGKVCAEGQSCMRVFIPPQAALGGPGEYQNQCLELCTQNDDCGAGRICFPRRDGELARCVSDPPGSCASDGDCTEAPCGRCVRSINWLHGGYELIATPYCVYSGSCAASGCDSCLEDPPYPGTHRCY